MIVRKSTYDALQREHMELMLEHMRLLKRWNDLVDKVNARGGEKFLLTKMPEFTKDEIKLMIRLCHPDKHQGDADANTITAKLLSLR